MFVITPVSRTEARNATAGLWPRPRFVRSISAERAQCWNVNGDERSPGAGSLAE
jgi:hypothetical protein